MLETSYKIAVIHVKQSQKLSKNFWGTKYYEIDNENPAWYSEEVSLKLVSACCVIFLFVLT